MYGASTRWRCYDGQLESRTYDGVRNDDIRQKFDVVPTADKPLEARLLWHDHVCVREKWERPWLQHFGKWPNGGSKQRWLDTLYVDLKIAGIGRDKALD